jgi:hypothetical protein
VCFPDRIRVETGGFLQGEFSARGELSMDCCAKLVLDLRRAMREIRDERTATLNAAITRAERPVP